MYHKLSRSASCILFALACAPCVHAQTLYNPSSIGDLGFNNSTSNAINSSGQIAGYSYAATPQTSPPNTPYHAVTGAGGTLTDITPTAAFPASANALNDAGTVVGQYPINTGGITNAFVYKNLTLTPLPTFGVATNTATGINAGGLIVGSYTLSSGSNQHAYTYDGTSFKDLGTLGGNNSRAYGVNKSGTVVGASDLSAGGSVAFKYEGTTLTSLGTLPGGISSQANAVNTAGIIVGYSTIADGSIHAFSFAGNTMTDLGSFGSKKNSFANAINTNGDIVGTAASSTGTQTAFIYTGGTLTDLNSLLPRGSGWLLRSATGINDNGWITGTGDFNGKTRGFIIRPGSVPAPSSLLVAGLGVFALGFRVRRRRANGTS